MAQVKAVPEGFTTVTPFLNIKGAAEAIEFYKKAFGAEQRRVHKGPNGLIMNAELMIGNAVVRLADALKDPPTQSSLSLYVDNADAWWKRAVDAGCEVVVPLATMFWGDKWGLVKDRFGTRWSIAQHVEDVSEDELHRRAATMAPPS